MAKAIFKIYSDGSSFNNGRKNPSLPMFAACGMAITLNGKVLWQDSKGFDDATISYAELKAAITVLEKLRQKIEGLKKAKISKPYNVTLYSDSQFVVKGVNEWMAGWVRRDWTNNEGKAVGQLELWKELKEKFLDDPDYDITFVHVKGHTGNTDFDSQMNHLCDRVAARRVERMKKERGLE